MRERHDYEQRHLLSSNSQHLFNLLCNVIPNDAIGFSKSGKEIQVYSTQETEPIIDAVWRAYLLGREESKHASV